MLGGVCGCMRKHFRDLKKMLVGGGGGVLCPNTDLNKNVGGVCQQIYGLEKCWGGGGVMPNYFRDLKKCWGGWVTPNIL